MHTRKITLLLVALFLAIPGAQQAFAQSNLPPAVIAVIDSQLIRRESAAGKDIQRQINTFRTEVQSQLQKEEQALKDEEAELRRQRALLTPEAFDEKRRAWEQKVVEAQNKVQDTNQQLQIALNKALAELERALLPIYQRVLENRKATMILDKSIIVVQKPGLDVTTEVIEQLDQALPSVKVDFSQAAQAQVNQ